MFTYIDTFVVWFSKSPIALFLVGYIGARVLIGIWYMLTYDCHNHFEESEDSDNE